MAGHSEAVRARARAVAHPRGWLERDWPAALPLVGFALVYLPLLWRGLPTGHDWPLELVRIAEYGDALRSGDLPPGWAPGLYGGYGSPIFLFYAPLHALVASLLGALAGSRELGMRLAMLVAAGAGLAGMHALCGRAAGSRAAARAGAGLYLLSPYLIGDAFLRNADAEFTALCLLPAALAALLALREAPRRAPLALAAGFAGVLLAHNLTALVAAAALLVAALLVCGRERRLLLAAGGGLALGLALAAFFWLPALALNGLVRPEELLTGKFDFHSEFPPARAVFGYAQFYSVGLLPLGVLGGAAFVAVRQPPEGLRDRLLLGALAASAALLFMLTKWSTPLWEHLPYLAFFQFPWRLLGPFALASALAGALALAEAERRLPARGARALEAAVGVLVLLNAAPRLGQIQWLEAGRAEANMSELRARFDAATVKDEYLPRTAHREVSVGRSASAGPVVSVEPPADVRVARAAGASLELDVQAAQPARLRLARWAFPGWQLEVDGAPAPIAPSATGAIDVQVPAGHSHVSLRWVGPPLRRAGSYASLAALAAWLALVWRERARRRYGGGS